jgi:hypothetical protein
MNKAMEATVYVVGGVAALAAPLGVDALICGAAVCAACLAAAVAVLRR